jgi:hypothetical protein
VRLSVEQRFHTKGTGPRHPAVDDCRQGRLEGDEGGTLKRSMATSRERRITNRTFNCVVPGAAGSMAALKVQCCQLRVRERA